MGVLCNAVHEPQGDVKVMKSVLVGCYRTARMLLIVLDIQSVNIVGLQTDTDLAFVARKRHLVQTETKINLDCSAMRRLL